MKDDEIRWRANSQMLNEALDEYKNKRGVTRHQASKELTTSGLINLGYLNGTKEAK